MLKPTAGQSSKRTARDERSPEPDRSNRAGSRSPGAKAPRPPRSARAPSPPALAAGHPAGDMRIAKALARAGLCSRREAERWIAAGRVSINGERITSPARDVGPADCITVDGKPLPDAAPPLLWRYHKPRGLVTTHRDPEGRPTVFEKLPPELPRVISIGRLDFNTEGLLLLTNDGALARHLELPANGWIRRYRVRVHGRLSQADLDRLKDGLVVDGVRYGPITAVLDRQQGANAWLTIALTEGKNREVRKVLASLGLEVSRLIRVSFGPFQLGDLAPGAIEQVSRRHLVGQLGARAARELGLAGETGSRRLRAKARKAVEGKIANGPPAVADGALRSGPAGSKE